MLSEIRGAVGTQRRGALRAPRTPNFDLIFCLQAEQLLEDQDVAVPVGQASPWGHNILKR
jgi:hypothetical protein